MTDTMLRGLIIVGLTLWTIAVVLVTMILANPHPVPVHLDLGTITIDRDGRVLHPTDLNHDGYIIGDLEMGS